MITKRSRIAWRNWTRARCWTFLFGWVWRPRWSKTRSHVTTWVICSISCCRLGSSPHLSFLKGSQKPLEIADDMAIGIPYVWQYIAELVNPVLQEGGISLRELLIEFSKPLLPVARAGILFAEILQLLCKQMVPPASLLRHSC
ncbi:eukaryotic translation initiation factor 4 gamma 3-like isoform X2 [Silurus meridionalis]|uniref:eukaryotic translation initiation factor 4 gamma 3-like isoform X2 n=1 Tax=Silurus meridionalis TaxID=175797 RepID=UPI001EEB0B1A|nr:eukaryotic translation initiation factor 4 gamma 3-like isoform X2 [Silurus meridionalis]